MIARWWRHLLTALTADEHAREAALADPATRDAWLAGYQAGLRDARWIR